MNRTTLAFLCLFQAIASLTGEVSQAQEFPKLVPKRRVLPNGLTVLVLPQHQIPLASIRFVIGSGGTSDPVGKEGLATMTASLLKQGAGDLDAGKFADAVGFLGAQFDVDYSKDATFVSSSFLPRDLDVAVSLLSDMVSKPRFSDSEIERRRLQMLSTLARTRERAGYLVNTFYNQFVYGAHTYGRPVLGTQKSISVISRKDILSFHDRNYEPPNCFIVVVGDVAPDTVVEIITRYMGAWNGRNKTGFSYRDTGIKSRSDRKILLVNKEDMSQAHVRIGAPGIDRRHPDYFAIQVANTIFGGGGFTSRLVDEIRVNRGLTYDISSRFSSTQDQGTFTISSFTRTETAGALIDAILTELQSLRTAGVTDAEISASKQYIAGTFPLALEGPGALATQIAGVQLFQLDEDYLQSYTDSILDVKASEVATVIDRYFVTNDLYMVVMGNATLLRPQLQGYGLIEQVEYSE